jgi:hypothetical protein
LCLYQKIQASARDFCGLAMALWLTAQAQALIEVALTGMAFAIG